MGISAVTFKDQVWRRIMRQIELAGSKANVRVGVLAENGGNETEAGSSITMIELAAIHEFGAPSVGIPCRSFIRSTFRRVEGAFGVLAGKLTTAFVQGTQPMERSLGQLGAWGVAQIKTTIRERQTGGFTPEIQENRPETIARKGSSLPLVDTGRLINAITWFVDLKGDMPA